MVGFPVQQLPVWAELAMASDSVYRFRKNLAQSHRDSMRIHSA